MSNKEHPDAILYGYRGPFFPESVKSLHQLLYRNQSLSLTGTVIIEMLIGTPLNIRVERLRTADSYTWFWCLVVRKYRTEIVIALPWTQDFSKSDGTQSDRHIALYTKGRVSDEEIDEIIGSVIYILTVSQD